MLSAANFALDSTSIRFLPCKEFPYRLFDKKGTIIELDKQDNMDMVAGNQKMLINNREAFFSPVGSGDVIFFENNIFVLTPHSHYGDKSFFAGLILYNNIPSLLFIAPDRVFDCFFKNIHQILFCNSKFKQIIINCQCVDFLDSAAIKSMMALINFSRQLGSSIFFYSPNSKFNSYLTLVNIGKIVKRITYNETIQVAMNRSDAVEHHISFVLKNSTTIYGIRHDIVNYVGRTADLCNILLANPSVSRMHSAIIMINNCVSLIDCGSTNGTYVNNKKLTPFTLQILKINDRVFFGNTIPFTLALKDNANLNHAVV